MSYLLILAALLLPLDRDKAPGDATPVVEGYKEARWGMSREQVASGLKEVVNQDGSLFVTTPVAGHKALTGYSFTNERLSSVTIVLMDSHTNDNGYIEDFKSLKALLTKKYGEPQDDRVNWKNELYRDEPHQYGFAVSLGHLVYFAKWETNGTTVDLICNGGNYKVNVGLKYTSQSLAAAESGAAEQKKLDDL